MALLEGLGLFSGVVTYFRPPDNLIPSLLDETVSEMHPPRDAGGGGVRCSPWIDRERKADGNTRMFQRRRKTERNAFIKILLLQLHQEVDRKG
jgi:hypothetical protein